MGYQRYNKKTGKAVEWGDIVKGYQYKKGEYVALSDEDFRQANVKASQTIDIESFTDASAISPEYHETPYYLVPAKGGEKGYTLLREVLRKSGKVAVGSFVMRGRQHIGMILPAERALMFITLRFEDELKSSDDLELPASAKSAKVSPREVSMAERLVEEMTAPWKPGDYHDSYREDLMKRIKEKIRKKQTHVLTPKEKAPKEERQSARDHRPDVGAEEEPGNPRRQVGSCQEAAQHRATAQPGVACCSTGGMRFQHRLQIDQGIGFARRLVRPRPQDARKTQRNARFVPARGSNPFVSQLKYALRLDRANGTELFPRMRANPCDPPR